MKLQSAVNSMLHSSNRFKTTHRNLIIEISDQAVYRVSTPNDSNQHMQSSLCRLKVTTRGFLKEHLPL